MNHHHLLLVFLSLVQVLSAQKNNPTLPDSLMRKSYAYLDEKIYILKTDSSAASVYLYAYLRKALHEKNAAETVNAYQNLLHQSPEKLRLVYADSMILTAQKTTDNALIGSAYLSKGIVYYGLKQQKEALDHYILANNFISRTDDEYLSHKVKYNIALVKYYLGYYDEAISYFKDCILYFKGDQTRPYLNSLHALSVCYNKIGNYVRCSQTNNIGLSESKKLDCEDMEAYFLHSEGINDYFKGNYGLALKNIESSLATIRANKDFGNETVAYFYMGKSYQRLKKPEKALLYFEKVDQAFTSKGYIRPDLREAYELLISHHKETHNLTQQLHYVDQLLKADDVLDATYEYLTGKLHKEYDTKQLLSEKEHIRQQFLHQQYNLYFLVGTIVLLCLFLFYLTYRLLTKRKKYKKKFEKLMLEKNETNKGKTKIKINHSHLTEIAAETVTFILKQLDVFEQEKKFLAKDLKLSTLAAICNSNTTYLSQIISHHKGKGFNDYINDLKIDYIIALLKEDRKVRNYTNTALAEEAGFSTTQRFVHAFKAKTKMPPSYFIEELKKGLSATGEEN